MLYGTFPIATNIGETSNIVGSFGDIIPINQSPNRNFEIDLQVLFRKEK